MQFWRSGSVLLLICVSAQAQLREASSTSRANPNAVDTHRNDELTLAGLRPGRDAMTKALRLFTKAPAIGDGGASRTWRDECRHEILTIIADDSGTILARALGFFALVFASINIFGGFLVTQRMLAMYQKKKK